MNNDLISRQEAIEAMTNTLWHYPNECYRNLNEYQFAKGLAELGLKSVPSVQPEVIHCGECRYYKDVTSIHGDCECGEMWQSLFGEITEVEAINVHKDHYCGYAERKYENDK